MRFKFDKNVDAVAAATFLLSLVALGGQIYDHLQVAEIRLLPSDVITLLKSDQDGNLSKDARFVGLIASMTYVNEATSDHPGVVLREAIAVAVAGCTLTQRWDQFVNSRKGPNGELVFRKRADIRPFTINGGGGAESHETLFTYEGNPSQCEIKLNDNPNPYQNPNDWRIFNLLLTKSAEINITTSAILISGKTISSPTCLIELDPLEVKNRVKLLDNEKVRRAYPSTLIAPVMTPFSYIRSIAFTVVTWIAYDPFFYYTDRSL